MYQALFFSLSSQRSKEAKKKFKKITPDLRLREGRHTPSGKANSEPKKTAIVIAGVSLKHFDVSLNLVLF